MKIKGRAQPLVFRFAGARGLSRSLPAICAAAPECELSLCRFEGFWYLEVWCAFSLRRKLRLAVGSNGDFLGASPVLYSYFAEHGTEVSRFFRPSW